MLHGVEIHLEQFAGMKKGVYTTAPLDKVYATKGGKRSLLGYVARVDGAALLLIRYLPTQEDREAVRQAVEKLRHESGWTTNKKLASVPNPTLIKAYVDGEVTRKSATTTTIVMPDGSPASEPEPETKGICPEGIIDE